MGTGDDELPQIVQTIYLFQVTPVKRQTVARGVPVFAPNKRFISNIVRRSEVIRTLHLISHLSLIGRLGLLAVTYFLDLVRWE